MPNKKLSRVISLRLMPEDLEALDKLARKYPGVPRLTLARIALRRGVQNVMVGGIDKP